VWCWRTEYPNPGVCDGTGWSLSIRYSDKKIQSSGDNNYPAEDGSPTDEFVESTPFERLLAAIRELTGKDPTI
jgi:hypothetical protein